MSKPLSAIYHVADVVLGSRRRWQHWERNGRAQARPLCFRGCRWSLPQAQRSAFRQIYSPHSHLARQISEATKVLAKMRKRAQGLHASPPDHSANESKAWWAVARRGAAHRG